MKYILGVFGVIVLLVLLVVLILRIGPDQPAVINQTGEKQVKLADYEDTSATAQITVRGVIRAREEHRAVRISVSPNERVIEIIEGYDENVINRRTYPNSREAYKVFLSALEHAGFTRKQETDINDERGVCPLGERTTYLLQENSEHVFRTWSSTCSGQSGSYGGNKYMVKELFEKQIPDYREVTRTVRL